MKVDFHTTNITPDGQVMFEGMVDPANDPSKCNTANEQLVFGHEYTFTKSFWALVSNTEKESSIAVACGGAIFQNISSVALKRLLRLVRPILPLDFTSGAHCE